MNTQTMQVSVDTTGVLGRRVTVAVPAHQLEQEISARLKQLARTVRLPGFRPGKVPMKVIESKYAGQALGEAASNLIERTLYEALEQHQLVPAVGPEIEPKTMERGKDLEYIASFDLYPEIKKTDLQGIKIERPVCAIEDSDVDETIERMRKQRIKWTPVTRPAAEGDQLIIDFNGTIDGAEFPGGKAENYSVTLGSGSLLKEFEENLQQGEADGRKSFEVQFPDDYHGEDVAGKRAHFEVHIKEVREPVLPAVDEDFAKSFGIADGDLWKLKNEVKENLNRELDQKTSNLMRERVLNALVEINQVELPQKLVDREIDRIIESNRSALQRQGIAAEHYQPDRSSLAGEARRRVTLGLVIREIVQSRGMKPDEQAVRARIEQVAAGYEDPPGFVQWYYSDKNRLAQMQAVVLEEQVVAELLKSADVTDRSIAFGDLLKETGTAQST